MKLLRILLLATVSIAICRADPLQGTNAVANIPTLFASTGDSNLVEAADARVFTTINSDLLDFDYQKKIATFEGNVIAVDPQLKLSCRKMVVTFGDKNSEVSKVEAYDDVHMYHEGKEGIGEKAVFTREKGIVILSGGKARLRDEKGNWVSSRGDGIIYDIHTKEMKVDKPTLELVPSSSPATTPKPDPQTPRPPAKP